MLGAGLVAKKACELGLEVSFGYLDRSPISFYYWFFEMRKLRTNYLVEKQISLVGESVIFHMDL